MVHRIDPGRLLYVKRIYHGMNGAALRISDNRNAVLRALRDARAEIGRLEQELRIEVNRGRGSDEAETARRRLEVARAALAYAEGAVPLANAEQEIAQEREQAAGSLFANCNEFMEGKRRP